MRGFKMFRKKERDYLVEEIKKGVSEVVSEMELSDTERFMIEEIKKALKDELFKINLAGLGVSKDKKEFIVKVKFQGDVETLKKIGDL